MKSIYSYLVIYIVGYRTFDQNRRFLDVKAGVADGQDL